MNQKLTVWTLSWDTQSGTDCRVFGTESEWFKYFRTIIESDVEDIESKEASEIRSLLAKEDIDSAYEIWRESYKPELDTYNWDVQVIAIDVPSQPSE